MRGCLLPWHTGGRGQVPNPGLRWQGTNPACLPACGSCCWGRAPSGWELSACPGGWGDTGGPCHMPVGVTVPLPYPAEWPWVGKGLGAGVEVGCAHGVPLHAAARRRGNCCHQHRGSSGCRHGTKWRVPLHHAPGQPRGTLQVLPCPCLPAPGLSCRLTAGMGQEWQGVLPAPSPLLGWCRRQRCLSPLPLHLWWQGPVALPGIGLARIYFKKQQKMRKR